MSAMPGRLAGLAVAGAVLGILVAGSQWPWTAAPDDVAVIRLDWRASAERVEECRPPTDEEIAERPPHMRPREICEGRVIPYSLHVVVDRVVVVDDTIHGAGVREDRPLYVAREIVVSPGLHDLRIDFETIEPEEEAGHEEEDPDDEDDDDDDGEHSPSVSLAGAFRMGPRQVLVVTYDPDRRSLVASAEAVR